MEEKKELSPSLKRFFGFPMFFFNTMTQVQDVYFNFFLTNVAMLNLGLVTFIQTTTNTILALISWTMGAIISGTKPMKWGRNRSWLIATFWAVPFFYIFKFKLVGTGAVTTACIIILPIIASFLWQMAYVAELGLISVLGKKPEDRLLLSSNRGAFNRAATITFSFLGLPVANIFAKFVGEGNKFAALGFFWAVCTAIAYWVEFKMTEGYESVEMTTAENAAPVKQRASVKAMAKGLFANPHCIILIIADTTRWIANFVIMACLMYYWTYVAHNTGLQATYLLIANSCCVAAAIAGRFIGKKLGNKNTVILGFFVLAAGLFAARFMYQSPYVAIACMAFAQLGYGTVYSLIPTLYSDAATYAEYKTGEDASTWIMGLNNLPLNIGLMARGLIINGILAAVGFSASIDPATATVGVQAGIANAMMLVPGVITFVGGLLILFGFRINDVQATQMRAEIEARKTA